MSVKVFDVAGSSSLNKVLAAAKYADVAVEAVADFKAGDNQSKQFLAQFPSGVVPSAETADGNLSGGNALLRYFSRSSKGFNYGDMSTYEQSLVDSYLDMTINEIDLPASVWLLPIRGVVDNNPTATNRAKGDLRKVLVALNNTLANRTFLVGERVSIADLAVAFSLFDLYTTVLDPGFRKQFVHTNRWFQTIINQPNVKAVVGDVKLCTKMAVAPKPAAKKEEPKKKQQQQKKQQPKKEQPKAAPKAAKPARSKLLDLPKSSMDLEEWKRTYSNEDTRPTALDWLWKNFDDEGYSFWFCEYNYPEDNSKAFMCANLVGGWMQRCDPLRKFGFGVMCIFGEDGTPPLEILGVWIFRGQEIPDEMKETPDYESFSFKKADHKDADTKELIEDYLAWDGKFAGKKFTGQAKIFK